MDKHVLPNATEPDARVFFLKMKGDYYRYLSEIATAQSDAGDSHQRKFCFIFFVYGMFY